MLSARLRQVLEPCRHAPETYGPLRRPDRQLAIQLYNRGVPLDKIKNALVLAAVRRLIRPANALPLATFNCERNMLRVSFGKHKWVNSRKRRSSLPIASVFVSHSQSPSHSLAARTSTGWKDRWP